MGVQEGWGAQTHRLGVHRLETRATLPSRRLVEGREGITRFSFGGNGRWGAQIQPLGGHLLETCATLPSEA
jgi:hypothetical protein